MSTHLRTDPARKGVTASRSVSRRRWGAAFAISAVLLLAFGASPLVASRAPTRSEAAAIKKAFFERYPKAETTIRRIRISTVNKRFSAVTYTRQIDDSARVPATASTAYKAPTPVIFRKATGGWRPVPPAKVPANVKRDLGKRPAVSNVSIGGDLTATLRRGALCSRDGVNIYDPATDILVSMQLFTSKGPGTYDAKAVGTVVGVYRNNGTELAYESGQPTDATIPSGFFHIDEGGWGIIDADLHVPPGGAGSGSITMEGTWECR